ncbi:uncharacterized protein LOC124138402 isoform X2 [Haliotis rufescens]|uniref:uncharacterized protein LOC124138402 isoform X2 n=1 Tax=Haliotis rufescens TaxID=6454 RepID=UPI00201F7D86|nr:uncharacterized protein LOC124138402 isoform X2 [Haliotis rufescens]
MQTFRFVWTFGHLSIIYALLVVLDGVNTQTSHAQIKREFSQEVNNVRKINTSRYHGNTYEELRVIFGMNKNKKTHPTSQTPLNHAASPTNTEYDSAGGHDAESHGQPQSVRKSQQVVESNSNEIDGVRSGKRHFQLGHAGLATRREYTVSSTVKTTNMFVGNGNVSHIVKTLTWKEIQRQKFSHMVQESPMLLGAGVGVTGSVIVALMVTAIYLILKRRRLDESNFSVDSDGSSEEELFDLSTVVGGGGSPCQKNNLRTFNKTSTPTKDNRFR